MGTEVRSSERHVYGSDSYGLATTVMSPTKVQLSVALKDERSEKPLLALGSGRN
jgi:hypothetical protein